MATKDVFQKTKVPRHPAVWWSRNKPSWPFFVWLAAAFAAWYLYSEGMQAGSMVGVVDKVEELIAPLENSIVREVLVNEGDSVTAGQPLIVMDSTLIDSEISVEDALGIQEVGDAENYHENVLRLHRQFATDVAGAQADLMEQRRLLAEITAESAVLAIEETRLQKLMDQRMADARAVTDLGAIRAKQAALGESIKLYPKVIETTQNGIAEMQKQLSLLDEWLKLEKNEAGREQSSLVLDMIKQANELHLQRKAMLLARKDKYTLKAEGNGIVSQILFRPGSMVSGGIPILSVIHEAGNTVVALIPEGDVAFQIKVGMTASVKRQTLDMTTYNATVQSLGPEIFNLPTRVNTMTETAVRGRRVVLTVEGKHDMIPGETVQIYISTPTSFGWFRTKIASLFGKSGKTAPVQQVQ